MTTFERFAPAIALFYAAVAGIALAFGAVVLAGGSPVTPELYGPAVYAIPALVWVGAQVTCGAMAVVGAVKGWPVVASIGAHGVSLVLAALATLAIMAGATGTVVVAGSIFLAALSTVAAQVCWRGRHERRTPQGA